MIEGAGDDRGVTPRARVISHPSPGHHCLRVKWEGSMAVDSTLSKIPDNKSIHISDSSP